MLQWVQMEIPTNNACERDLQRISRFYDITANMICAGLGNNLQFDSCQVGTTAYVNPTVYFRLLVGTRFESDYVVYVLYIWGLWK